MAKLRLDQLLCDRGIAETLEKARALIMSGLILVDQHKVDKSGTPVKFDVDIRVIDRRTSKYVSRGGNKLEGVLKAFHVSVKGKIALDVGMSTGGFTDCLLQHGVLKVIGIDVAYGIAHNKMRQHPDVILLERINARLLTKDQLKKKLQKHAQGDDYLEQLSLVVMDLSFISVLKVLPAIRLLVHSNSDFIVLIKPQFEAPKEWVESGGVIRKEEVREIVLNNVETELIKNGFQVLQKVDSLVRGTKGNQETFFLLKTV